MCLSSFVYTNLFGLAEVGAEQAVAAAGTKFADSFLANLTDALTSKTKSLAYLFECHFGLVVDAEAALDNLLLALVEDAQGTVYLGGEAFADQSLVGHR